MKFDLYLIIASLKVSYLYLNYSETNLSKVGKDNYFLFHIVSCIYAGYIYKY